MNKIDFLLWFRSSKMGESAAKVIDFEKKVTKYIEDTINSRGGIGGIPINIDFEDIYHTAAGRDEAAVSQYLEKFNSKNMHL